METSFTGKTASGPSSQSMELSSAQIRYDPMRCEQIRRHRQRRHRNCRPVLTWLTVRSPSPSLFELCLCLSPVRMINNKSNAKMSVMYVACQRLRLFMAWINKNNAPIRDYKLTQRQKTKIEKKKNVDDWECFSFVVISCCLFISLLNSNWKVWKCFLEMSLTALITWFFRSNENCSTKFE